tara:strand:+ start:1377 stop:1625 length:249 start_codon:yes stop_codon:yes gene_type:complete
MAHKLNIEQWDNFNLYLYSQRVKKENNGMNVFRIKYRYFKNSQEMDNPIQAIDYVVALDRAEAIKVWDKWEGLIVKIEKINS